MFEAAALLEKSNKAFAVVTVAGHSGTVPREEGRMIVSSDGSSYGTIGGGEAEIIAREHALSAIMEGKGCYKAIPVRKGGEITVYIDVPVKDRRVFIIGSGHVAKAVAECFYRLKWTISIVDSHSVSPEGFPPADFIISEELEAAAGKCALNENSAVVITDPEKAAALLPVLLESNAFYIGILASRKWNYITDDRRVHVPVGLSIGAESPEEIAVAVAAEVLASFTSSDARPCSRSGLVVIRGAGDLATGVAVRLFKAGYKVIMLDIKEPTVIRRTVSFAEAFYEGETEIEGVRGRLFASAEDAKREAQNGIIPLLADPDCSSLSVLHPLVLVDAIIAKRNLGTRKDMAPLTIALGPGFTAGADADAVIETKRGHHLGSVIKSGTAIPNSGIPGVIGGYGKERVIHSENPGVFRECAEIGDIVRAGDIIAYVDEVPVRASIDGKLRGLLHSGLSIPAGFKIADIDPRGEAADHTTISDKARAVAGGVLEAVDSFFNRP